MAMQAGATGIVQDVPPFCVVYDLRVIGGLNLVGLRRAGLRAHIKPLEEAFRILFRERRAMRSAAKVVEEKLGGDPLVMEMLRFIRTSKRGICRYVHRGDRADDTSADAAE
jgi:UDP-N-acetylglucosamine acyltransferase